MFDVGGGVPTWPDPFLGCAQTWFNLGSYQRNPTPIVAPPLPCLRSEGVWDESGSLGFEAFLSYRAC